MAKTSSKTRAEGMIRHRGNSFQAVLYAGVDPVTGRELYLRGFSPDEAEAKRMLRTFRAQVTEQRHATTRASLRTTIEAWLDTHELEASTREGYLTYANRHIYPVLGDEPLGRVTTHVLERFYAGHQRADTHPTTAMRRAARSLSAVRMSAGRWRRRPCARFTSSFAGR